MYKSTEISIPVKVDQKFDLCPFLTSPSNIAGPRRHSSTRPCRPSSYYPVEVMRDDGREKEKHSSSVLIRHDQLRRRVHTDAESPPRQEMCVSSPSDTNRGTPSLLFLSWVRQQVWTQPHTSVITPAPEAPPTGSSDESASLHIRKINPASRAFSGHAPWPKAL